MKTIKEQLQAIVNILNAEMTRDLPDKTILKVMATQLNDLSDYLK